MCLKRECRIGHVIFLYTSNPYLLFFYGCLHLLELLFLHSWITLYNQTFETVICLIRSRVLSRVRCTVICLASWVIICYSVVYPRCYWHKLMALGYVTINRLGYSFDGILIQFSIGTQWNSFCCYSIDLFVSQTFQFRCMSWCCSCSLTTGVFWNWMLCCVVLVATEIQTASSVR